MAVLTAPPGSLYGKDNLPYGVYTRHGSDPDPARIGVRVHDHVLDLALALADDSFAVPSLNPFLAAGPDRWRAVRTQLQQLFGHEVPDGALLPLSEVDLHLPFEVGDYVDFYCSEQHASNLGRLFRPGQPPLTPNWKHLPIGYHGRSGTVVVSGTDIRRPVGQRRGPDEDHPAYGPSIRLDIECEVGFVVGPGSELGSPIGTAAFDDHVFGVVLVNDWSARDLQAWEYVPLGPHLGKSFATTISPWVVPLAALAPARVPTPDQGEKLPYLAMAAPWGLDLDLAVAWNGEVVSRPPYRAIHWSPAQMLAHLTSNGASVRPGDLFASGTVSGDEPGTQGAFIELTWNGEHPVAVNGEPRSFLLDGDEVTISGTAPGPDGERLGLGECRGRILRAD